VNQLTNPPHNQLLIAHNIEKTFDENVKVNVLNGLNLEMAIGEMISIVGVSGTGKSTLMHILGTLDAPTKGQLLFKGEDVFAKKGKELSLFRNKEIGFVFQFHHLLPEFTAIENIMMPGLISGSNKTQLLDDSHELLKKIGLDSRAQHKIGELSGGEQQRVALARALIMKPSLLLADEPTGNLDPKTGRMIFELLAEMNESYQLTTVMVTHNYELADRTDRCLTLSNGTLH
jgi:lipoprotein-releasing system ATP-binding protein